MALGTPQLRRLRFSRKAIFMFRTVLALVLPGWLALGARSVAAADVSDSQPVAKESAAPSFGRNFTVARSAIAMIWIAPGTFVMSNPLGGGDDTEVTLTRGYWLGRTEVTQAQWQAVAEKIPVFENIPVPSYFKGSDRPVERVTWDMAMAFCAQLSEDERAAGRLPPGYAYSLPTEAQWEYGCRAGTTGKYAGEIAAMAWYDNNSGGETHPVAQKRPNPWGFYDMHGNVVEWCVDWYGGYPGGRVNDPIGPVTGVYRVRRGGAWNNSAGACRSGARNLALNWNSAFHTGFRIVLAPQLNLPAEVKPPPGSR